MCACNKARVVSHLTFLFSGLGFSRRIEREPGDDCMKPFICTFIDVPQHKTYLLTDKNVGPGKLLWCKRKNTSGGAGIGK